MKKFKKKWARALHQNCTKCWVYSTTFHKLYINTYICTCLCVCVCLFQYKSPRKVFSRYYFFLIFILYLFSNIYISQICKSVFIFSLFVLDFWVSKKSIKWEKSSIYKLVNVVTRLELRQVFYHSRKKISFSLKFCLVNVKQVANLFTSTEFKVPKFKMKNDVYLIYCDLLCI